MDETIDKIKRRFDIVEVISNYLPLKKAGKSYRTLCPFHEEGTASFFVSPSRQTFHCFGCGISGDVISFIMKWNKVPFREALGILSGKAGGYWDPNPPAKTRRQFPYSTHSTLASFPRTFLPLDGSGKIFSRPLEYLVGRDVSLLQIAMYDIGYVAAPGRYKDRLIFPIYVKGNLQGFVARAIKDADLKYLYPKGMRKSGCLFGYDIANGFRNCILVEGVFDTLRVGFDAIAILGSSLSTEQISLLYNADFQRITIMLDSDAFEKSIKICRQLESYFEVHLIILTEGDPGSHSHRWLRDAIDSAPRFGSDESLKEIVNGRIRA